MAKQLSDNFYLRFLPKKYTLLNLLNTDTAAHAQEKNFSR